MPKNLYLRSLAVMTVLWGLVFALLMAFAYIASMMFGDVLGPGLIISLPIIFSLIFVFIQFWISPWIMDLTISWIYDADKYSVDELPPHIRDFLYREMELHNFSLKFVVIIHDNNPNAFVYGHTKKRARMAITRGIMEYLTEEEQIAVVAHECGHIIHRDFIWMTVASAIPLLCYSFYQGLFTFARYSSLTSSDDDSAKIGAIAFLLAILAYIVFFISHYIVLFLSRVREYYADSHSAETTGQPGSLSRALVKIAYGMVKSDREKSDIIDNKDSYSTDARKQASRQKGFSTGLRALGIFDSTNAKHLAQVAYGTGINNLDEEAVAKAASWDLHNPWGGFLELFSTHPLPAKRIKALNKMQEERGEKPEFPGLGSIKPPESLWDEFLLDLFLMYIAPLLWLILPLIFAGITVIFAPQYSTAGVGVGFITFAAIWKLRRREKYPKIRDSDPKTTIITCLTDMTKNSYYEASPLRGKVAVLEGKVVGRGIPGYFLSEDLVIQDDTGLLTLDYSPILGFMSWIFALFRAPKLIGSDVKVYGWYHRSPGPILQVWKVITYDGKVFKNRWSGANWLFNWFFFLLGIAIVIIGIAPM